MSKIVSPRSDKTFAIARATAVFQSEGELSPQAIEEEIDQTKLRLLGKVTERRLNSGRFEYSCEVEYGPVFGANESDFKRALSRKANGPVEVFNFSRRELTAKDVEEMEARLPQIESLAERKQLEQALTKMRQGSGR